MSLLNLPVVAKKVFYPCKKCETERYQVVTAHTGATSARLECEVCKTKNTYYLEEPKKTRSAVPKKKSTKKATSSVAKWQQLRDSHGGGSANYNMKTSFEIGAALQHPKFGLGFVIGASIQAIHVVFEDSERSLVHNRPA
jgi:hypothetical protein